MLHVEQGGAGPLVQLHHGHHEDVHLLGRVVSVVLLAPELRVHLELDVIKVHLPGRVLLHVGLGHEVVGVSRPVVTVGEITQLLPGNKTINPSLPIIVIIIIIITYIL